MVEMIAHVRWSNLEMESHIIITGTMRMELRTWKMSFESMEVNVGLL